MPEHIGPIYNKRHDRVPTPTPGSIVEIYYSTATINVTSLNIGPEPEFVVRAKVIEFEKVQGFGAHGYGTVIAIDDLNADSRVHLIPGTSIAIGSKIEVHQLSIQSVGGRRNSVTKLFWHYGAMSWIALLIAFSMYGCLFGRGGYSEGECMGTRGGEVCNE